jgi:hypothetical protein
MHRARHSSPSAIQEHREDERPRYAVLCPRCETISNAADQFCPYCGADRHGAVITRTNLSLLEAGEAGRTGTFKASHRSQALISEMPSSHREAGDVRRFPTRYRLLAMMTVSACMVIGYYGLTRMTAARSSGEPSPDLVSSSGVVHKVFASPEGGQSRVTNKSEERIALTRNDFAVAAAPIIRVAFNLHTPAQAARCTMAARPTVSFDIGWCDMNVFMRAAPTESNAATWGEGAEKKPQKRASIAPADTKRPGRLKGTSHGRAHPTTAQSVRVVKSAPKAHAKTRATQQAKNADILPLQSNSAAMSPEPPSSNDTEDSLDVLLREKNGEHTIGDTSWPINRGRGEAH